MNYTLILEQYIDSQPPGYIQQNESGRLIATAVIFIVLEIVATILRAIARYLVRLQFGRADILMSLSLFFNLAVCAGGIAAAIYHVGQHWWTVTWPQAKGYYVLTGLYLPYAYLFAVSFPKLAIADLYLHVFVNKKARYVTYATALLIILNMLVNIVAIPLQCRPITLLWGPSAFGQCFDVGAYKALASLPNIVTDLIMLILPLPMIFKLQMPNRAKIGIALTFSVGGLGFITSIVRFLQFFEYASFISQDVINPATWDQSWIVLNIVIWTIVEPGVYHLTACAIAFRPLFPWLMRRTPSTSMSTLRTWPQNSAQATASVARDHDGKGTYI